MRTIKRQSGETLKGILFQNKSLLIGAIIFSVIIAGLNIALAFILKLLINISIDGEVADLFNLLFVIISFLSLYLVVSVMQYWLKNKYVKEAMVNYKNAITDRIIKKDLSDFRSQNSGSYISVINNDVKTVETDYVEGNIVIITQATLFIFALGAMFYLNVQVAVVAILLSLLPVITSVAFNGKVSFHQERVSEKNAAFTTTIKDIFNGFTVIKSFGVEKEVSSAVSSVNTSLEVDKRKFKNLTEMVKSLTEVSGFIVVVGTFTYGTWLAINGKTTPGDVLAYIQLLNYLLGPIVILAESLNKRKAGTVLIRKIDDLLLSNGQKEAGIPKEQFDHSIVFDNVSFSFDGDKDVLTGIHLKLEKNKSYAIVGLSGSGKSTLLNLLMGYYDSYKGNIYIDDVELRDIDPTSLYIMLSVIQQEVFMFDAPIENNIFLYKSYPREALKNAITMSGLDGFIEKKGPDFNCGENGAQLSGGEKQRVSIARALIKGTPVLLLDEATSSLDNETAQAIEQSILNIKDNTRIIVTHKLNGEALQMYDEIIMMKNGSVAEKGSFLELLEKKGFFYSLYHVTNNARQKEELTV
ncbi:MAG: ABC transporter ATP-binding protein/permease [Gorillibacterium sp.]|nr:ABC transporter ATP-binding protein/permease [Gorillibacterium sp.]